MAIGTPVEVGSGQWTTGSTIAITLTAAVPAGSTLILFSNVLGALAVQTPVSSVADAASNPWVVGLNKGQGGGPEDTDIWFGRMNTGLSSGGTVTVTYSGVGGLGQGIASLAYVTGLDTTAPKDKAVGATGSSTAPSSGTSGTLTQADEICIGVVGRYNAASTVTLTSIGSFTAMTKQQNSAGTTRCTVWPAYQIVSATTAQTYSGTLSVTGAWEAIQVTFKGAAAATSPPPQGALRRLARLPWIRGRSTRSQTPLPLAAQPPPTTRRTPQRTPRLRGWSSSRLVPPPPTPRPPQQPARARLTPPPRRRARPMAPVGVAGFIAGTHQLPVSGSMNLALPPGSVLNGWVLAVEADGSSTPTTGVIAGSTTLLSAAANNMYVQVLAKQLNATDISNGFLAVTGTTTGSDWWALAYDTSITGFDTANPFPLSAAAYGTRGGVTQAFTTAPGVTPNSTNDYIAVLSFERTIGATTVSSISQGVQDYYNEDVTTSNVSVLAGHFLAPTVGFATSSDTVTYSNASGNGLAFLLPMTTTQSTQVLGPLVPAQRRLRPRLAPLRRPYITPPPQVAVTVTTQALPPQPTRRRVKWLAPRRQAPVQLPPSQAAGVLLARQPTRRRVSPAFRRAARPSQLVPPQAIRGFIPAYFYPTLGEWATLTTFPNQPAVMIANPASGPGTSVNSDYTTWIGNAVHSGIQILGYVNLQYGTRPLGTAADTATSNTVFGDLNGWLTFYPNITGIFFDLSPTAAGADLTYTQSAISYARSVLPTGAPVWINPGAYPLVSGYIDAADVALVYENDYQAGYQGFTVPSWAAGYVPNYPATKFAHLLYNVPTAQAERVALGIASRNRVGWFFATNSNDTFSTLAPYWATDERFDLWTLNTAVDDPIARLSSPRPRPRWVPQRRPYAAAPPRVTVTVVPAQPVRRRAPTLRRQPRPGQPVPPQIVVVTAQALPPQPGRRPPRLPTPGRHRTGQVVPTQIVVVTVQALPPQPGRRPPRQPVVGRHRNGQPVPAPAVVVTVQALPPQGTARPRAQLPRRQPHPVAPPLRITVTVPAQPVARRRAWLPRRKSSVGQFIPGQVVVVTVQQLPPQPGRRAPIWLPRRRPRVRQTPPPQVVIPVPGLAGSIGYIGEGPMGGDIDHDVARNLTGSDVAEGPMGGAVAYDVPRSMIGGIDN